MTERSLPQSEEAEKAILAAVLLDNRLMDAARTIPFEHFYAPSRRKIFAAMVSLHDRNVPIEPLTIGEVLRTDGALQTVGGISALVGLTIGVPHSTSIEHHRKLLAEKQAMRWAIKEASRILEAALGDNDPAILLAQASERFAEAHRQMSPTLQKGGRLEEIVEEVEEHLYLVKAGVNPAISTGLEELDRLTGGGMRPGEFWGIAARSSRGKSSFLVQLLRHQSSRGYGVVLFTLEMRTLLIALRILAAETGIPLWRIRPGMHERDIDALLAQAREVLKGPFWVYSGCRSVGDIRSRLRALKRQHRINVVGIDYYGLLSGYGSGRDRYENRTQELKYISAVLQQDIAIEEKVALIVPAQFNRSGWGTKEPGPANIDGGEAYHDACDLFAVLDVQTAEDERERASEGSLKIYKQRNGPTGSIRLMFNRDTMRFAPRLEDEGEPDETTWPKKETHGHT